VMDGNDTSSVLGKWTVNVDFVGRSE